jgi:hypothetical protein
MGLLERPEKSVRGRWEDLGSTDMSTVGELSGSVKPAHVPRSAALEARAADIQCAALLAALSSVCC